MNNNWNDIFDAFKSQHVVVVGDVMLDNYWWGDVERISPEAPVPVVNIRNRESRLGGAANVALNCKALGAQVTLASVVGNDEAGEKVKAMATSQGVEASLIMTSTERPTTSKTRVLARNHQMMRLDEEETFDLTSKEEHQFIDKVLKYLQIEKPQALIFEDYNKGVLKENVIHRITEHARNLGIVTAVDPKLHNFLAYRNVDIFKPNLKEVKEGLHFYFTNVSESQLDEVHKRIYQHLHNHITYITLSEKGVYYNDGQRHEIIPTHVRNIADVSGAGDTVIATATLTYAVTKDAKLMAELSNLAGGQVCEYAGVVPVNAELLKAEAYQLIP